MSSSTDPTPTKNLYVHIGAPAPIIVRYRAGGTGGTLVTFDSSLKFMFVNDSGSTTLMVGSGITLSTDETIANARATILNPSCCEQRPPLIRCPSYWLELQGLSAPDGGESHTDGA